jgi:hypothetical protein
MRTPVVVNLPDFERAPGYRDSLTFQSEFLVQDYGTSVTVQPREGSGATRQWFTAYRLCDDTTELTDATWEPLRRHPPREHATDRRDRVLAFAEKLAASPAEDLPRQLQGLRARVFALGSGLPHFLNEQMSRTFPTLPGSSLWFIATDETLMARLAFLRSQLALTLTPDIAVNTAEFEGLNLLGAHSYTQGVEFSGLFELPTLIFSPAFTALVMSHPPHALVLFFGQSMDLRRNVETSLNELFKPRVLNRVGEAWTDERFRSDIPQADAEALLPWWTERLNILFSHATDPTGFADRWGRHDPAAQTAWQLTLERLLADATLLLGDPSQPDIVRSQLAFDLLDKCENLLGYSKSGPGFKELLRRSTMLPRLNQTWAGLPGHLERRFRRHARAVFDSLYEDVREHGLSNRRTKNGMLVATEDPGHPRPMAMEDYVSRLLREARNSAHGLSRQLRGRTGLLVATHDGAIPTQLADVAALVAFALAADADKLRAGNWW